MDGAEHHVERYVRDTFGLDEIGLRRVAVFLLAHVLVDTRLIARALFKRVSEEAAGSGLPLTRIHSSRFRPKPKALMTSGPPTESATPMPTLFVTVPAGANVYVGFDRPDADIKFFLIKGSFFAVDDLQFTAPPEPATLLLLGSTMAGLGFASRWRRRRHG